VEVAVKMFLLNKSFNFQRKKFHNKKKISNLKDYSSLKG
jgi:hypothetical protein